MSIRSSSRAPQDSSRAGRAVSDHFVLAVLIHELLMDGLHPFHGRPGDGAAYLSVDDNVLHGRARLLRPESVRVLPGTPPLSLLPRELRALFRRCFDEPGRLSSATRPTATDWVRVLDEARALARLKICPEVPGHVFTAERPWCPWCDGTGPASGAKSANSGTNDRETQFRKERR
jgi:DNA-binding helix-hairpin-helix protein with protein kinase domain